MDARHPGIEYRGSECRAAVHSHASEQIKEDGDRFCRRGLFRQEAVGAQRREWLGSILVAAPLSRWLLTVLALILATATLLFLFFGHCTRRETVTGQLVPSAGLLNIAAPSAGPITRVHVHDGQAVKAGDALPELPSLSSSR